MAFDAFLKIDGIDGEAADSKHKGEIHIESFSWGLSNSGSRATGGGGGAGKAAFEDFTFTAAISKASPKLMLACASGEHIKQATLSCRKAGSEQQDFYVIKLTDILISGFQQAGSSGDEVPTDQFSINYAKVEVAYREAGRDGSLGSTTSAGWDVKANVKL